MGSHNSPPLGAQRPRWHTASGFDTIYNISSRPLVDIVLFGFSLLGFLSKFLKHFYYGEISTPLQGILRFSLQPMWDLTIHPLGGLVSSLAHSPMSGSDTICNSPSPPLADIVLFRFSLLGFPSKFLEHVY